MGHLLNFCLLLLFAFINFGISQYGTAQQQQPTFDHEAYLDKRGNVRVLWRLEPINNPRTIVFEVHGRARGYVAVGFSQNGAMPGADIILGYIDRSGVVQINDYHASTFAMPQLDRRQDIRKLGGRTNGTHLVFSFSRLLETCDPDDWKITDDTTRMLYAYSDTKPQSSTRFAKHVNTARGSRSVHFMDPQGSGPPPARDRTVRQMEFTASNVTLPNDYHTLYWCMTFRQPTRTEIGGKRHLIRFEPIIQAGNEPYVHHMILYACSSPYMRSYVNRPERCFDRDGGNFSPMYVCTTKNVAGWAVGGEAQYFPENVGYPLFESDDEQFFMLEMHYDNSAFRQNVRDNSGIRLYYTSNIRPIEADTIQLGTPTGPKYNIIPPNQPNFINYGFCNAACTRSLPRDGVWVYSGLLHTHLAGSKVVVRHIRNGVELEPLFQDLNYDFNYQENRMKKTPVKIMPGDELIVECYFNTIGRNETTYGGYSTAEEMCNAYIGFYPKSATSLVFCGSSPSARQSFGVLGARNVNDMKPEFTNAYGRKVGLKDWIKQNVNWGRPGLARDFQDTLKNGTSYVMCMTGKSEAEKLAAAQQNSNGYGSSTGGSNDYDWIDTKEWNMNFYPQRGWPRFRPYVAPTTCRNGK